MRGPLAAAERAAIRPQLITDFYGYNTGVEVEKKDLDDARKFGNRLYLHERSRPDSGLHWVGDLAVDCELKVLGAGGEAVFELVESGRAFQCRLDLGSGLAHLRPRNSTNYQPQGQTPIRGPGTYRVQFANIDDQLLLWIDGKLIPFDGSTAYDLPWQAPTQADFGPRRHCRPPGPTGSQPPCCAARHLLHRGHVPAGNGRPDHRLRLQRTGPAEHGRRRSDPKAFPKLRPVEFTLEADQFLALGDNSPRSKDSRLWPKEHYVKRDLLIGKAMFIYWPHALDHIPGTSIWFPFFPNFGRMKFIR